MVSTGHNSDPTKSTIDADADATPRVVVVLLLSMAMADDHGPSQSTSRQSILSYDDI